MALAEDLDDYKTSIAQATLLDDDDNNNNNNNSS